MSLEVEVLVDDPSAATGPNYDVRRRIKNGLNEYYLVFTGLGSSSPPTDNNVLKVFVPSGTNTIGPSNWVGVRKDFSDLTEAWLTFDMTMDQASLDYFFSDFGVAILVFMGTSPTSTASEMWTQHAGSYYWHISSYNDDVAGGTLLPVEGEWVTLELHFITATTFELYINGTLAATDFEGSGSPYTKFEIGHFQASAEDIDITVYYRNVKLGTTRGGSQIFSDDFSSGDLSNWSAVLHEEFCTVVPDPF